jgi:hypothetical protein
MVVIRGRPALLPLLVVVLRKHGPSPLVLVLHKNQQGSNPLTKVATGNLVWLHLPDLRPSSPLPVSHIKEQNKAPIVLVVNKVLFANLFAALNKSLERP